MPAHERRWRHHAETRTSRPDQGGSSQSDIFARLEAAIGAIHESDGSRHYLDAQSRFHDYSFGNVVLILSQRPDATQVAGYATWQSLHRQVRRGERGIRIIVPMRRKENENDTPEESRVFFGTGSVFDISETEGEPLPEVSVPVLQGEAGRMLMESLLAVAGREGVRVKLDHDELPSGVMGEYRPAVGAVGLAPAPMRQMVRALAHELAHHARLSRYGEESRIGEERETVAEAVAYVVYAKHGIDTGERSFAYIATWAKDGRTFNNALGAIQEVSAIIIDGISEMKPTEWREPELLSPDHAGTLPVRRRNSNGRLSSAWLVKRKTGNVIGDVVS